MMTQSNMMAAFACCLLVAANASESELLFQGRDLQEVVKPRTLFFTEIPKPEVWLSSQSTTGLILGFVSLGIFLVFTMVKIILDEYKRHTKYQQDVKKAQAYLRDSLDCDENQMKQFAKEFLEFEKRGGKPIENDDDVNLVN
jgi:hypothetical protein